MVSTFTPNIQWEEPARGDDVGVWDTPVNNNGTLIDLITGAINTISLNNSNVVLSNAQFQSKQITFNSTLTGNVIITFPTSFIKSYEIQNLCTGSSAFTITLETTAGGQVIAVPPGETIDCFNDGSNIKFKNLGRVGSYWDYCGSSVPNWVSACTVPPYLNCVGGSFSSATFPALAVALGGTTLPDSRSRNRIPLDQGAGRISSAVAGFSPNTVGNAGGDQNFQAHTHANNLNDPTHTHTIPGYTSAGAPLTGVGNSGSFTTLTTNPAATGMTITNASAGSGASGNVPPTYVGGLTLIRAA